MRRVHNPHPVPELEESHNIDGTASVVCRRWPQTFAREFPERNQAGQDVMKAIHMPLARWMFTKNKYRPRGNWGWSCDLCSCKLDQNHFESGKHKRSYTEWLHDAELAGGFLGPLL